MGGCGLSIMFTSLLLPIHLDHDYVQPVGAVSLASLRIRDNVLQSGSA